MSCTPTHTHAYTSESTSKGSRNEWVVVMATATLAASFFAVFRFFFFIFNNHTIRMPLLLFTKYLLVTNERHRQWTCTLNGAVYLFFGYLGCHLVLVCCANAIWVSDVTQMLVPDCEAMCTFCWSTINDYTRFRLFTTMPQLLFAYCNDAVA